MTSTGSKKALLAQRIAAAGLSRPESATPARDRAGRGRADFPLSFAQRRMWLHQQIVPDSSAYNLGIEITFTGRVSEEALETALRAVQRRHEVLRTTYHDDAGTPYQRVHPELPLAMSRVDLTGLPEPQRRARVGELARQHAARSYDLARESSLRVVFVRESGSRLTMFLLVHHIAWDGLTFAAFSRDIERYYREALDGRTPAVPDETVIQYADHAAAEQRAWDDDDHQAELEFWREQLRDAAPALFDGMRAEREGAAGEEGCRVDRRMSASATGGLRLLARELDTTPYVIFLSCYLAVLSRYGSAADVSVGTAVLNREDPEIVDLVGNFGNIVVLRSEVRAADSFRDLVARVKRVCAAGFAHQQYPYDKLVEKLNPDRTAVGGALFDAMLLFLTQRIEGPQLPGARTSWYRTDNRTAQHPLAVEVFLTDELLVEATYSTAHLSGEVVGRLLAELEGLLDAAAARPADPLATLLARAATQPQQQPQQQPQPEPQQQPRPEGLVVDMFRDRAGAEGREVALLSGDRVVSYAELDGRSDQLARALRDRGVGPETRVAVLLPRSVNLVVALLAVLKAGGVVVPVDLGYPPERIGFMLADSAPRCVISTESCAAAGQAGQASVVLMEEHRAFRPGPRWNEPVGLYPDHAAYLVYTSGSTGRPKGVVGTHGGLANRLAWAQRHWPVTPGQTRIAKSSISFIDGLTELLAALLGGARVVLADDRTATDVAAMARLLSEHEVGQLTAVPSVVAALTEVPGADLSTIRRWVCSGEPLPMSVVRSAVAMSPESIVTNSYGSSEVAGDVLAGDVDGRRDGSVTVGCPVPGAEVHLLDRFLNPVPPGVVGEVYVGGVQLARGYAGRAGLSAARFVADPHGGAGARLYRTGDLGRWTAQGRVQLLGRTDQQVKVRGVRVEPGEVEAVLAEHDRVAQAAVVAREDLPGGLGLVAYLVPAEDPADAEQSLDTEQVRSWARSRLPAQLVPALILTVDALPRTPTGKLDRRALPAPDTASGMTSRPPRTDLERTLCGLFGEVLQRPGIGVDDGFFALGGHSLLALRLVNRIRSVLRVDVSFAELFTAPTVAALAGAVEHSPAVAAAPPTRGQRPAALPLSAGQRQIWGLVQVEGPAPTYNVPRVWHVHGGLDTAALHAAVRDVVDRHEVLRTTYRQAGDEVTQSVHDVAELPPSVRWCPVSRPELDARIAASVRHCFDLRRDSPVRLDVFTLIPDEQGPDEQAPGEQAPDEHVVVLTVHHIAVDEWSYRVLLRDLSAAYAARVRGGVPEFDPLPVQYADFALWQRDLLGAADDPGSTAARQLEYWTQVLAGAAPETTFPGDRPRPELPSGRGAALEFEIGPEVTERLLALADEHQVTMFMVLHTAIAVLLGKHGAGEDIVIGSPISQRRDDALDGLVGFFLNTLALRVDLSGNPTVAEALARVRATDLAAMRHQEVPFEQVVERLNPERSAARNPLFQVEVVYLRTDLEHSEVTFEGASARPSRVGTGTAKFDAGFQFFEGGSAGGGRRIQGVLEYAVDLFDEASMRGVVDRLHRLLELFVADPRRHLSETRILSSGDQLRLLDRREAMPARPDRPRMLHRVFEDAVAARPDAVALVAGAQRLTYRELEQRANRVARLLQARGCRPGTRIGIGVPRSAEMVVALLGVLKAGGTYVPVDVSAPAGRLAMVLGEAGPLCVLTTDAVRAAFARVSAPQLVLDAAPVTDELAGLPGSAPDVAAPPDTPARPAYVIYTSGSTGRPKGVEVSHASVTDLVTAASAKFDLGAADVWTLFHSVAFDVSVFEMWGAFTHAARLVVVDHATTRAPDLLWALVAREQVTVLSQTPSAFHQLAEAEPDGAGAADSLRYVVFAGEALEMRRLRGWYERHAEDAPRLVNMYGITETTVHATYRELDRAVCDSSAGPVGGPLPGLGIYLLDQQLNLVPPGVTGELYVAGGQLAQGYAERPALTGTRFVANPFSDRGERLYRSGDLARWNSDGELEFAGRCDDQVKLRGYRIELGEIETALLACPGVGQAVATLRADIPGHRQLVGYVVPAGGPLDVDAIRAALATTLPEYMVPAAVVELDQIPLTLNGKLDRRALPAPQFTPEHTSRSPRNSTEHLLCRIYADALNLDEVGADDDFFALGGDSILAIQVVNRAGRKNVLISARDIFRVKTPAALAELAVVVDDDEGTPEGAEPTHIPPLPIVHRLAEFSGSTRRYNQSMLVEFPAGRSVDALRAALQAVIDRHDALRQRLARAGRGHWTLEAMPPGAIQAADVLRHVTVPEFMPDGGLQTLAKESDAATDRLDPEAGTMLQAVSCTAQDEEHGLLLLVVHHLAVDAVSWLILLDDLEQAWLDAESGGSPQVAPVRTPLAEFGRIVTEQAHSKRFLTEYEHWHRVLAPGAELLPEFGGGCTLAGVAHELVAAPPALTRSLLADLPQQGGTELTEVLLAALLRTVASWRRRSGAAEPAELTVDVERHGREELTPGLDLSRTVGWFTTVAPVRLAVHTDRDALLDGVRNSVRGTTDAGIGFGMLRYLHPQTAPRMARLSRPQILFNYLGRFDLNPRVVPFGDPRRNALRTDPDPDMEMPYPLELNVMIAPGSDGPRLEARFSAPREALTADDMAVISHEWLESLTWLTNVTE